MNIENCLGKPKNANFILKQIFFFARVKQSRLPTELTASTMCIYTLPWLFLVDITLAILSVIASYEPQLTWLIVAH